MTTVRGVRMRGALLRIDQCGYHGPRGRRGPNDSGWGNMPGEPPSFKRSPLASRAAARRVANAYATAPDFARAARAGLRAGDFRTLGTFGTHPKRAHASGEAARVVERARLMSKKIAL